MLENMVARDGIRTADARLLTAAISHDFGLFAIGFGSGFCAIDCTKLIATSTSANPISRSLRTRGRNCSSWAKPDGEPVPIHSVEVRSNPARGYVCFANPIAWTIIRCISSAPTRALRNRQNCIVPNFKSSISLAKSSGVNIRLSASTLRSSQSAKPHFNADATRQT